MRVLPLTPEREQEWDDFASRSDEAWLFHRSEWMRIESARESSVSFLVESDGTIAGIFPLYIGRRQYARVFNTRMLHTGRGRSGPALSPELSRKGKRAVYQQMFQHAGELAKKHGIDRLEVRLPSLACAYLPPLRPALNPLSSFGPLSPLKYGHSLRHTTLVDKLVCLGKPADTLWADLDKDCRNAIRKAQKNGVAVTAAASRADVEHYHRLHTETYRRTGAGPQPIEHFHQLWDALYDRGFLQMFFAQYEGRKIAAVLLLGFREGVTYWAGSSDQAFQHLRANNLLIWHAMEWARSNGYKWFELGPTFPFADPASKISLIGRFKDQFGGEAFDLLEGAMNYTPVKTALLEIVDALAADAAKLPRRLRRWRTSRTSN